MANEVVRLNANLQPEAANALDDLATRIGGNRTTALHQAILLADLLYAEADDRGTIQIKKSGLAPRTVVLTRIDPGLAAKAAELGVVSAVQPQDAGQAQDAGQVQAAVQPQDAGQAQDAGQVQAAVQPQDAGQAQDPVQAQDAGQVQAAVQPQH